MALNDVERYSGDEEIVSVFAEVRRTYLFIKRRDRREENHDPLLEHINSYL